MVLIMPLVTKACRVDAACAHTRGGAQHFVGFVFHRTVVVVGIRRLSSAEVVVVQWRAGVVGNDYVGVIASRAAYIARAAAIGLDARQSREAEERAER